MHRVAKVPHLDISAIAKDDPLLGRIGVIPSKYAMGGNPKISRRPVDIESSFKGVFQIGGASRSSRSRVGPDRGAMF